MPKNFRPRPGGGVAERAAASLGESLGAGVARGLLILAAVIATSNVAGAVVAAVIVGALS